MTVEPTSTTQRAPERGTRHLIHRPTSWEHYLLDAPSSGEEHFVLAGSLPAGHPPSDGGPVRFHDAGHVIEELREVGEFVGHRYFGVRGERPGLFSRLALALTDVPAWRAADAPPRLTTYLTARPEPASGRVPHALALGVEVRIGDVACCAGEAAMVFPAPAPHRGRIEFGRRALRAPQTADEVPDGADRPVDPAEVGRRSPAGVLLGEPSLSPQGRLTTWVVPRPGRPVPAGAAHGALHGLLLEALRQTSVLTAVRACGYDADRALVAGWDVRFRGQALPELPLRCAATPGPVDKDDDGRPSVPVAVTVTQRQRVVAQARTRVVQDL